MIRGTTPTQTFGLPVSGENVKNIRVTYSQDDEIVLEKKFDDVRFEGSKVIFELSQEETFKFKAGIAEVQLRVLTDDNKLFGNEPITIYVIDSKNEEIL